MRSAILGLIAAFASVLLAILLEEAHFLSFLKLSALVLILGGTAGATFASYTPEEFANLIIHLRESLFPKRDFSLSDVFLDFAEKARKNGLLSLEDQLAGVPDAFLRKGIQLIVDGTDPRAVEEILFEAAEGLENKETRSAKILETAGGFSPTIGIIGTVMGLVSVLENLGAGTRALGEGIATAFIATFYGIAFANLAYFPLANRLRTWAFSRDRRRQAIIRGIISLQTGDNRRILVERMAPFL
ncbi:motility protein A [Leptospira licerasiae]|uniref:Transporter, MotA/TolQ/ExbB proton channel family protein n=1 Tax=Leptospira licerasiae str. MMD4847 TaxID=1049971 RepID=A0ABN0H623_9LEPT|nr:MotA/TolQ/ExbB proton channel family protein [Leptospira licerasiae]EIE02700.1 transporter, MotA/TolQ/ExbB proton channel family protein [Leptospira licerasiae serovar Varillal str. VAR 010]EJZ40967.1 transporter, MotA/TolQ/ExbB proton channel family protein [Leptospira licerasiae str. MMD4847]